MQHSAGFFIYDKKRHAVLLLRCYNHWGPPKGHVEQSETVLDAAVRETYEETGLLPGDYRYVNMFPQTSVDIVLSGKSYNKKVSIFFAVRESNKDPYLPVNPELGHPEHEEWRWVPVEEMSDYLGEKYDLSISKFMSYISSYEA